MGFRTAFVAILALGLALSACGRKPYVDTEYREDVDVTGEDTITESRNIEFDSAIDMKFRDARQHLQSGRYRQAILSAQSLYRDLGLSRERRAEALLLWAEAEGSVLNPGRDLDSAIARIELLLQEFGDTKAADEAEDALERMRSFQHDGLIGGTEERQ